MQERYFTPLFDHGSSLMFELPEDKLQTMLKNEALIERYIGRSYGFILNTSHNKANIFTVLRDYVDNSNDWRDYLVRSVRKISDTDFFLLEGAVNRMPVQDDLGWTVARKQVLVKMLRLRYTKLQQVIEKE